MARRTATQAKSQTTSQKKSTSSRSKEHHVAVGLNFWSAFKQGDIDACVQLLHPDVIWYPTPKFEDAERVRGSEAVRDELQILHDRFHDGVDVLPEDGRQVGDHVLIIPVVPAHTQFARQLIK